jgi:DNA-binding Lrp family transcriptional regulator
MKRKGNLELDKKDREILYLLDLNGRLSYSQIARKVKISKQVAKYRIERLEKEGFIKGYFTMIDTSRLGYTTFRVYLKFRNLTPDVKKEIIDYLKSKKQNWAVVLITGKWDIALGVTVTDIYDFYTVWEKILNKYLEHIGEYTTCIYSPIFHYSKSYLIGEEDNSKVRILGGNEKASFDQKDIEILTFISNNARVSLLEVSKKLDLTPEAISSRLKILEKKGIIQGYRAMIDVNKFGYEFYKAEIRLSDYGKIKSILNFCHLHPNIYQVDKTIGGETLEIEFHVKSVREMLKIIEDFEIAFPNVIERFDYITILSEEKTTYMPHLVI